MKHKIYFADIDTLIDHERTNPARLRIVRNAIQNEGVIRKPVIVDKASHVILDGHHRVAALREMGVKRVPVAYVRYEDETVRVYLRRKDLLMRLIKRYVVDMAKSHERFPSKTTRHLIRMRPMMTAVKLTTLM
jgi:hypothetical protein